MQQIKNIICWHLFAYICCLFHIRTSQSLSPDIHWCLFYFLYLFGLWVLHDWGIKLRPNKKIHVLRVPQLYLNLLLKPRIVSGLWEKYNFSRKKYFYAFWKGFCLSKCMKILLFFHPKKCAPTLPKMFRNVTRNTLIFSFGLTTETVS